MERLKKVENVVEKILEVREDARENDDVLYLYVCEYFHRGVSSMSLKDFLMNRKKTSCPVFETVRRTRQKIFNERPELRPSERITQCRKDMEEVYKDYAIS